MLIRHGAEIRCRRGASRTSHVGDSEGMGSRLAGGAVLLGCRGSMGCGMCCTGRARNEQRDNEVGPGRRPNTGAGLRRGLRLGDAAAIARLRQARSLTKTPVTRRIYILGITILQHSRPTTCGGPYR
jgi:hypothetical protein